MYESFFGFERRPFPVAPATELYFPAASIEQARGTLTRLIERAEGPGMVIGAAGTGKSLLCQVLAEQFGEEFQVAQLASGQICTRRALLQALLYSLGLPYRARAEGELRISLVEHLTGKDLPGKGVLLIIDEAHGLPLRLLEEIRTITNIAREGVPSVRLVLLGSARLEEHLANPKLESFSQRIAARCYLSNFEQAETLQYVKAQISVARGNDEPVVTEEGLKAVHRATDGVPRLVNQVCDHALVLCFAGGVKDIDEHAVEEAWADLQQLPLPQNMGDAQKASRERQAVVEFGSLDDLEPVSSASAEQVESMEEDDLAEAIPFPGSHSHRMDPEHQLERIANQLSELEEDFTPIGSIGPEVELIFENTPDPFGSGFDEEEVVFDRYSALDESYLRARPRVVNRSGDRIAEMIVPQRRIETEERQPAPAPKRKADPAAEQTRAAASAADVDIDSDYDPVLPEVEHRAHESHTSQWSTSLGDVPDDDRDMIIVEDEPLSAPRVRRQEYRQLFAKLRRSS